MAEERAPEGIAAKLADAEVLLQSAERLQEEVERFRREFRLLAWVCAGAGWSVLAILSVSHVALILLVPSHRELLYKNEWLYSVSFALFTFPIPFLMILRLWKYRFEMGKQQRALDGLVSLLAQHEKAHRLDPYRSPTMREAFRIRMSRFRIPPEPPKNVVRDAEALFDAASTRERSLGPSDRPLSSPEPTPSTKPAKATSG